MSKITHYLLLSACLLASLSLKAVNYSFNVTNGNWNLNTNWLPNGVPTTGDNVTIGSGKTVSLDLAGVSINDLTLIGTLQGVNNLSMVGNLLLQGTALLDNQGATTVGGTFDWQGGRLGLTGSGTITLNGLTTIATTVARTLQNRVLVLNGGGTWSNGTIDMLGGAIFRVPFGQTLSAIGTLPLSITSSGAGTRALEIAGQLLKTNTNTLLINVPVAFSGILDVQAGILDLVQGGTLSNTISFAASTVLKLSGGTLDVLQDMAMAGKVLFSAQTARMILHLADSFGALEMLGGILTLGGTLDVIGDCIAGNGTLTTIINGVGNLNVLGSLVLKNASTLAHIGNTVITGAFQWLGGTLGAVGTLGNVVVNGLITIQNTLGCNLVGRTLEIFGGGELMSGFVTLFDNAIFRVPVGALLMQITNLVFSILKGDASLNNVFEILGTLHKIGVAELKFAVQLIGKGILIIEAGIFTIGAGAIFFATSIVSSTANVIFKFELGVVSVLTYMGQGLIKVLGGIARFLAIDNVLPPQDMEIIAPAEVELGNGTIRSLDIKGGKVTGSGDLEIVEGMSISGGVFARSGNTLINGNLEITGIAGSPGGSIGNSDYLLITPIPPIPNMTVMGGAAFNHQTSIERTKLILNGNGTLNNVDLGLLSGSTLEIGANSIFTFNTSNSNRFAPGGIGTNKVEVKGTLLKAGNGRLTFDVPLINTGTVNVTGGFIALNTPSTSSGVFSSSEPNGIIFGGTVAHTLQTGATFSGAGSIKTIRPVTVQATGATFNSTIAAINIEGGSFTAAGTVTHSGNLTLNLASFIPQGNTNIGGNLTMDAGTIGSSASFLTDVNVAGTTAFIMTNSGFDHQILKTKLIMNGGGSWSTSGKILLRDGSTFEIPINQTFTFNQGSTNFEDAGTTGNSVLVKGTLRKLGAGGLRMSSSAVSGLISLNNTGSILIDGGTFDVNSPYSGNGSITTATGAILSVGTAAGLTGLNYSNATFVNNGTVSNNALVFNGSAAQTLSGTGTIERLTLNNTNGLAVSGTQAVTNTLTLTNGLIQLSNNDLTVGTTITGSNTSRYIQTNGTGNVKRTVAVGATPVLFPIGKSNYTPLSITQPTGTADVYSARVRDGIDPAHPLFGTQFITKEWNISRVSGSAIPATVKAEWNVPTDGGVGFNFATAQMLHYNGIIWEALPTTNRTTAANSLIQTNVTSFSPFAVGLPSTVLPLELLDFKAINNKSTIDLLWQTASEKDVSHFEIEQSTDAKIFSKIGETKAKGGASDYQFTTKPPTGAGGYFRLKMVDLNGDFTYSKVVSLAFGKDLSVSAYPNPVRNELTIDAFSEGKFLDIEVLDVLGRSIYQKRAQSTEGGKLLIVNTLTWNSGIYFLKITDGKTVFQQKIVKE